MAGGIQRNGAFNIAVTTSAGRIAYIAYEGKRLYKPITVSAVPVELREPNIHVIVEPQQPSASGNTMSVAAIIQHIVLKSKDKPDAVLQPARVEKADVEWANLLGGKVTANNAIAIFSLAAAKNLPPGDVDIVVVTDSGERRCKVGKGDRDKLFPPSR